MISSIPCTRQRKPLSICIIGQHNVGKTSLVTGFGTNGAKFKSSYGVSFYKQSVVLDNGVNVKYEIYDVDGFECYNQAANSIISQRDIHACVIVFDITKRETYDHAKRWVDTLRHSIVKASKVSIFMVGNKKDLKKYRTVSHDEAAIFAETSGIWYMETTVKSEKSINLLFQNIAIHLHNYAEMGNAF